MATEISGTSSVRQSGVKPAATNVSQKAPMQVNAKKGIKLTADSAADDNQGDKKKQSKKSCCKS